MIVVAKLKAKEGKEAELEKIVKDVLPKVKSEQGTLVYTANRSISDPTVFVFYEKYPDKEAMNIHMSTDHFKEMSAALGPLLAGAPEIEFFSEIGSIEE